MKVARISALTPPSSSFIIHHSSFSGQSRCGNTLVFAMAALTVCGGLVVAMMDRVTSDLVMEQRREGQATASDAANSAVNLVYDYVKHVNPSSLNSGLPPLTAQQASLAQLAGNPLSTASPLFAAVDGHPSIAPLNTNGVTVAVGAFRTGTSQIQGNTTYTTYRLVGIARYAPTDPNRAATRTAEVLVNQAVTVGSNTNKMDLPFPGGLYAEHGFGLTGNIGFNSWNSNGGTIACPYVGNKNFGKAPMYKGPLVGSGGSISISGSASIRSDPATEQNADSGLTGFTYTVPTSPAPVTDPKTNSAGTATGWTGIITLTTGKTYHATAVNGATLIINRPLESDPEWVKLYVDGHFSAGPLQFTGAAKGRLMVYQDDYNDADHATDNYNGNDSMGVVNDPESFVMISLYSGQFTFNGNGSFGGVLIAPNATISKGNGTFDFFGSLYVDSIILGNGNFNLHYDQTLGTKTLPVDIITPIPPTITCTTLAWRVY